jgi:chorismate lyase/3-hydroxybenzoate synthase
MVQGCEIEPARALPLRAPRVSYRHANLADALAEPGALAVFGFGNGSVVPDDPRALRVELEPLDVQAPVELWQVDGAVECGRENALNWSCGGGWLFVSIVLDERVHGGIEATAERAYRQLGDFMAGRTERHIMRLWNYLAAINQGAGDSERYKHFCSGRASGMGEAFAEGFPAATAIGHHAAEPLLQVYLLACEQPGTRVENPRQVSAWHYPRQYGPTPPSFARAMALPMRDALAISGTAAVLGHASVHANDLHAQLEETLTNLDVLLDTAGLGAGFDTHSPLKAYVRRPADAAQVRAFIRQRLPGVPVLLLHGDICRSELLVEIDGWRYA